MVCSAGSALQEGTSHVPDVNGKEAARLEQFPLLVPGRPG